MMKKRKWLAVLLAALQLVAVMGFGGENVMAADAVKVACVGDSITEGVFLADPQTQSYPARLQAKLGEGYEVGNFGVSKYAALKTSKFPYWEHESYRKSLEYLPDIVIIMLGTNDIKTENWVDGKERFVEDYVALIESYQALETKPQVFVVLPPPLYLDESDEVRPPNNLRNEAIQLIEEAAAQTDSYLINAFSAMDNHPELFHDLIHPNAEGAIVLADIIYTGLMNPTPAKKAPTWKENLEAVPAFDDPEKSLSREEFAMLVTKIFGLETQQEGKKAAFVDTQSSQYREQIDVAYQLGIIVGVDDAHFDPNGRITRQEISVMLYRTWKLLFPEADYMVSQSYSFVDSAEIAPWALEAVTYLYDKQIMMGTDILTISPLVNIPRKDGLTLMARIVEKYSPEQ